jgi:hypothetical protein
MFCHKNFLWSRRLCWWRASPQPTSWSIPLPWWLSCNCLVLVWVCQQCRCPTAAGSKMGQSTTKAALGPWNGWEIFGRLYRLLPAMLHHQSLLANKILGGALWQLAYERQYGLHRFLHGLPWEFLDLRLCWDTIKVSYPVPRKRERSLHTCAQDVQITHIVTIW